jgi:hypothetical protein
MNFNDDNDLFLEPKTNQYGSHMVMTNVNKPTKTKFINIDTKFRDEYNYNDTSTYNTTLPERYKYVINLPDRITGAKTIQVKSAEIPMTFYNISSNLGNNTLLVTNTSSGVSYTILLADKYYSALSTLVSDVNTALAPASTLTLTTSSSKNVFTSTSSSNFTITFSSAQDKYSLKSSLGWILGFRKVTTTVLAGGTSTATYPILLTLPFPRYLYLSIEEFNKGVQNSFVTPVASAVLSKNAIARVVLDPVRFAFGSVLNATEDNGLLVSDTRSYNGKVDLQRLSIQLFNESGMPIDLNGQDFSFCIEATYE